MSQSAPTPSPQDQPQDLPPAAREHPPIPLPSAPAPPPINVYIQGPPRASLWRRTVAAVLGGGVVCLFVCSVLLNLVLLIALAASQDLTGGKKPYQTLVRSPGSGDQVVAVLNISGLLDESAQRRFDDFWRQVKDDGHVKAVVLRVNSPGGSVGSCDQMQRRVRELKESGRKVVVSMGSVAASGGYYISAPADEIVAEPTTVTGSIGVLGMYPNIKGTLDKIGMKMTIQRSTRARLWKAAPNPFEEPASHQVQQMQDILDAMQAKFESVVRDGRGVRLRLSTEQVTVVGPDSRPATVEVLVPFDGRVYLAERARDLGLIDGIGYLDDAVASAARRAGLSDPKVVEYERRHSILDLFGQVHQPPLVLDSKVLDEIQTPKIMMLWKMDD